MEEVKKEAFVEIEKPSLEPEIDNIACSVLEKAYQETTITLTFLDVGGDSYVYSFQPNGFPAQIIKFTTGIKK